MTIDQFVRQALASAPPLDPQTLDEIIALLRPSPVDTVPVPDGGKL